jgi:hypothetical protein
VNACSVLVLLPLTTVTPFQQPGLELRCQAFLIGSMVRAVLVREEIRRAS